MKNSIYLGCLLLSIIVAGAGCAVSTTDADRPAKGSGGSSQSANRKKEADSDTQKNEKTETADRKKPVDDRDDGGDMDAKERAKKQSSGGFEMRCGWYENPTPGNHFLTDADDEWTIGIQGGHQADGDYPPNFPDKDWVATNGSYGYGCACLSVKVSQAKSEIVKVASAKARPLSACRSDRKLREPNS